MPQTKLKAITIRNWQTVQEAALQFPDRGLVLVQGSNVAAHGRFKSIGAGKTALGEAISRCLLGVPGRFAHLGHYSRDDKGDTLVSLECIHAKKPLLVEMGYKEPSLSPTGEALRFTYDGEQVWRDRINSTRTDLERLLTVSTDLAGWTVHLDGDQLKFGNLGQKSAVELLMTALMQPPWTQYHQKLTSRLTQCKRELSSDREDLERKHAELETADYNVQTATQAVERAETVYETALAEQKARVKAAKDRVARIKAEAEKRDGQMAKLKKQIEVNTAKNADAEKKLETEVRERREALRQAEAKFAELMADRKLARQALDTEERKLREMQDTPKNCPTCGKPWDKGHSSKAITAQEAAVEKATKKLEAARSKAKDFEDTTKASAEKSVNESEERWETLRDQAPVTQLSEDYEDLENAQRRSHNEMVAATRDLATAEAPISDSAVEKAKAVLSEKIEAKAKAEQAVQKIAQQVTESEQLVGVVGYWQEAFGPTGIPNMILRDAIGPLNETARRISNAMTGGLLQVGYSTTRALASGKEKAELVISVTNKLGCRRAEGSSKGEASLINLIVAETLAEVGNTASRIGYRWYDEVGANHDDVVRRAIFSYLRETANRTGTVIFLVTHNPEAASYADHILVATKGKDGTTYRWER